MGLDSLFTILSNSLGINNDTNDDFNTRCIISDLERTIDNYKKHNKEKRTRWSPRTRMQTRSKSYTCPNDTLVGHSCGTLLWVTLVGNSCGTLLRDTLVGHSCGTLFWDTL